MRGGPYWSLARERRYAVLFAMPLLAAYEVLALVLGRTSGEGIRNGADVVLRTLAGVIGGHRGIAALGVLLLVAGMALGLADARKHGAPRLRVFGAMALESLAWAVALGMVAGALTGLLLGGMPLAAGAAPLGFPTAVMLSLGAGFYEELVFRVLLVGGLLWGARRGLGLAPGPAAVLAVGLGALLFAAFHYVGPFGDRLALGSFTYRTIAGVLLSGLYVARGFGIAAWTHALYDLMLAATGRWS